MMRLIVLTLCSATLACGDGFPPLAAKIDSPRKESTVRIWLRSIQSKHKAWHLEGKGGLEISIDGGPIRRHVRGVDMRADGERLVVGNRPPATRVAIRPLGGVFRLAKHAFAGTLAWEKGRWIHRARMENYCLGVLRGELPLKTVPKAAAAALAIAVRSYTMHYLVKRKTAAYDVDDTTLFQRYVGLKYAPRDDHLRAGVLATRGLYLQHAGKPLKCYYHSTCGGYTADIPTGLNREVQTPMNGVACEHCRASKYFRWNARLQSDVVLRAAGLRRPLESWKISKRGPGGRAHQFTLRGGGKERSIHANKLRLAMGGSVLRSTHIHTLAIEGEHVALTGGGWGHGVGMCQMGAIGLGLKGWDGKRIARYYYPGARLSRAY